ncbi:hypothetical protein [Dorea longicatena]|nr:hypothetical protein [Dorea longicatena]
MKDKKQSTVCWLFFVAYLLRSFTKISNPAAQDLFAKLLYLGIDCR